MRVPQQISSDLPVSFLLQGQVFSTLKLKIIRDGNLLKTSLVTSQFSGINLADARFFNCHYHYQLMETDIT